MTSYLNDGRKDLIGSLACDKWKQRHKQDDRYRHHYAADGDLFLLLNNPHSALALTDFKDRETDGAVLPNDRLKLRFGTIGLMAALETIGVPSYVVIADYINDDFENITIIKIFNINPSPQSPTYDKKLCKRNMSYKDYRGWEEELRKNAKRVVRLDAGLRVIDLFLRNNHLEQKIDKIYEKMNEIYDTFDKLVYQIKVSNLNNDIPETKQLNFIATKNGSKSSQP